MNLQMQMWYITAQTDLACQFSCRPLLSAHTSAACI